MYYADLLSHLLIRATVMAQAIVPRQKVLHSSWAPDPHVPLVRLCPFRLSWWSVCTREALGDLCPPVPPALGCPVAQLNAAASSRVPSRRGRR